MSGPPMIKSNPDHGHILLRRKKIYPAIGDGLVVGAAIYIDYYRIFLAFL
jgi:hypothetical protein